MLPPKAWNLKAKIRDRRRQKQMDERLRKLSADTQKLYLESFETRRDLDQEHERQQKEWLIPDRKLAEQSKQTLVVLK